MPSVVRRKIDMEKDMDVGDVLRLEDNGKCYTIFRGTEIVGFISHTDKLKGIIDHPYSMKVVAYYGNWSGYSEKHAVVEILYEELGG